MSELSSAYEWEGRTVVDSDGEKIGKIDAINLEHALDPVWALVNTGLFGTKSCSSSGSMPPLRVRLLRVRASQ